MVLEGSLNVEFGLSILYLELLDGVDVGAYDLLELFLFLLARVMSRHQIVFFELKLELILMILVLHYGYLLILLL